MVGSENRGWSLGTTLKRVQVLTQRGQLSYSKMMKRVARKTTTKATKMLKFLQVLLWLYDYNKHVPLIATDSVEGPWDFFIKIPRKPQCKDCWRVGELEREQLGAIERADIVVEYPVFVEGIGRPNSDLADLALENHDDMSEPRFHCYRHRQKYQVEHANRDRQLLIHR